MSIYINAHTEITGHKYGRKYSKLLWIDDVGIWKNILLGWSFQIKIKLNEIREHYL